MKYIHFIDGKLYTRYDSDIHSTIPDDAVEVSDELFQQTIVDNSVDWIITDGVISSAPLTLLKVVITKITPRQIRMALTKMDLRVEVEAAVAAGSQDIKDWYEYSTVFERDNPVVLELAKTLGHTPAQLDQLWELGSTL